MATHPPLRAIHPTLALTLLPPTTIPQDDHDRFIGGVNGGRCKLKCFACRLDRSRTELALSLAAHETATLQDHAAVTAAVVGLAVVATDAYGASHQGVVIAVHLVEADPSSRTWPSSSLSRPAFMYEIRVPTEGQIPEAQIPNHTKLCCSDHTKISILAAHLAISPVDIYYGHLLAPGCATVRWHYYFMTDKVIPTTGSGSAVGSEDVPQRETLPAVVDVAQPMSPMECSGEEETGSVSQGRGTMDGGTAVGGVASSTSPSTSSRKRDASHMAADDTTASTGRKKLRVGGKC